MFTLIFKDLNIIRKMWQIIFNQMMIFLLIMFTFFSHLIYITHHLFIRFGVPATAINSGATTIPFGTTQGGWVPSQASSPSKVINKFYHIWDYIWVLNFSFWPNEFVMSYVVIDMSTKFHHFYSSFGYCNNRLKGANSTGKQHCKD